eukprot:c51588_g1_i1 orf=2-271(-)
MNAVIGDRGLASKNENCIIIAQKCSQGWKGVIWVEMILICCCFMAVASAMNYTSPSGSFYDGFYVNWGDDHVWLDESGQVINLKLDNISG